MKKLIAILGILLISVSSATAQSLRPINIQNAYIDQDKPWEVRVNFDWLGDDASDSVTLPRLDIRRSFGERYRVGINQALVYGGADGARGGAFGFSNLGLTLEAALLNEEDLAVTAYINQHFALVHNDLLLANTIRTRSGDNAYGFQTGLEYQAELLDGLTWYGDLGYRFDVPDDDETRHSFIYSQEFVWDTDTWLNPSLGLIGISTYNDGIGTDLRLVPGFITPFGDNKEYQFRIGLPIGLNNTAPDFGVQTGLFAAL